MGQLLEVQIASPTPTPTTTAAPEAERVAAIAVVGERHKLGVDGAGCECFETAAHEDVGLEAAAGLLALEAQRVIMIDGDDVIDVGAER